MIRPMNDMVLIRVLEDEERVSDGGIVYSHGCAKTHKRARVERVGPGRRQYREDRRAWRQEASAMPVSPGDLVLYEDWLVKWHDGSAEWPGKGDLALVPIGALTLAMDEGDLARSIDVTRLGRTA